MQGEASLLHSVRNVHGLEVSPVMDLSRLTVGKRIIRCYRENPLARARSESKHEVLELHSKATERHALTRSSI